MHYKSSSSNTSIVAIMLQVFFFFIFFLFANATSIHTLKRLEERINKICWLVYKKTRERFHPVKIIILVIIRITSLDEFWLPVSSMILKHFSTQSLMPSICRSFQVLSRQKVSFLKVPFYRLFTSHTSFSILSFLLFPCICFYLMN